VDRRGHGASDKPIQEYSIAGFADDLAWLTAELGLYKPVVVGHSMGGTIALELAASYLGLVSSIVMVDTPVFAPVPVRQAFQGLALGLRGPNYREVLRQFAGSAFLPTDDPTRKARILDAVVDLPQHVAVSSWDSYLSYDEAAAAAHCA